MKNQNLEFGYGRTSAPDITVQFIQPNPGVWNIYVHKTYNKPKWTQHYVQYESGIYNLYNWHHELVKSFKFDKGCVTDIVNGVQVYSFLNELLDPFYLK